MFKKAVNMIYWIIVCGLAVACIQFWVYCLPAFRFHELMLKNPNMFVDFVKFYTGAKILLAGQGHQFYDTAVQLQWLNRIAPLESGRELNYMEYTPQMLMLACLFGWLALNKSYALWSVVSVASGVAFLIFLRYQAFGRRAIVSTGLIATLFLGSVFSVHNMVLGQTGWLNVALVSAFFFFFVQKRDTICGIILALSTIKPQLLLLFLPAILARRRGHCLISGIVSGAIILGLAIWAVGWSNILAYPHFLFHSESRLSELQVGFRGLLSILLPSKAATIASVFLLLIGEATMFFFWLQATTRRLQHQAIGNCCVLYLAFCPHAFLYDCLLLAISTAVFLPEMSLGFALSQRETYRRWCYTILLLAPPLLWIPYLCGGSAAPETMLLISTLLIAFGLKGWLEESRSN